MRILELNMFWTVAIDFAAWLFFHLGVASLTLLLPDRLFARDTWLYRARSWERGGLFWDSLFKIKRWKERLPDGAAILRGGFAKKRLASVKTPNLARFILETRRAELTHWLAMLPAPLFFLWNPVWAGWFMILYAMLFNAPFVIVQRFNRPRFQKLLEHSQKRQAKLFEK